jgi:predicted ester cyclase
VAAGTSFNKLSITPPATGSTLTILDGKTLTVNKTLTLDGTDGTTITFPGASGSVAMLNAANVFVEPVGSSSITITGATQVTSKPVLDLSQTWNAGAVAFTGLKFNVTNTASAATSLLMDLQVGGTSVWDVRKDGRMYGGVVALSGTYAGNNATIEFHQSGSDAIQALVTVQSGGIYSITSSGFYGIASGAAAVSGSGNDVRLYRDAAGTLAQRNGTNAQIKRIYSTYTDASNYQRLGITGNSITSEVAGTGSLAVTTSQPVLNLAQAWNAGAITFTGMVFNVTDTASAAASLFQDWQVAGVSIASLTKAGQLNVRMSATGGGPYGITFGASTVRLRAQSQLFVVDVNGGEPFMVNTAGPLAAGTSYALAAGGSTSGDLFLTRDAADVLAQRRTTNAQTQRVYSTYTDASNYQRMSMTGNSITSEAAGTGSLAVTASLPILNLAQTFNNAAVAFNALSLTVTNTASLATSSLYDFKVGASRISALLLNGTNQMQFPANTSGRRAWGFRGDSGNAFRLERWADDFASVTTTIFNVDSTVATDTINIQAGALDLNASTTLSWNLGAVRLLRDNSDTIGMRNGTTSQEFRFYSTFTDTSNFQRIRFAWNGGTCMILPEGIGTSAKANIATGNAVQGTTATNGYFMIPSSAGPPTGVPANIPTGQIALQYDATNNQIYCYNGAWKKTVALT